MFEDENDTRCSFCGEQSDGELAEGGGLEAGGLPRVRICLDCAQVCADSLRTERRISEARASRPPAALDGAAPGELGQLVDWTAFTLDGKPLEWSAHRSVDTVVVVHLSVRNPETGQSIGVTLPGDHVPTVEDATMAAAASSEELDAEDDPERDPEISKVINALPPRDPKG